MIRTPNWRCNRITCTWYLDCGDHKMGIIRFHKDKVPGYYDAVVTVLVEGKEYEMLGFHADSGCNPPISEYRKVYRYLDQFGTRRTNDRAK